VRGADGLRLVVKGLRGVSSRLKQPSSMQESYDVQVRRKADTRPLPLSLMRSAPPEAVSEPF
jgi:hypothetical protein